MDAHVKIAKPPKRRVEGNGKGGRDWETGGGGEIGENWKELEEKGKLSRCLKTHLREKQTEKGEG